MNGYNQNDFMNYVGFQLYGGGTDPNFKPVESSGMPHIQINFRSLAFFALLFSFGLIGDSIDRGSLFNSLPVYLILSFVATLIFFLYVPWYMKKERLLLHPAGIVAVVLIFLHIVLWIVLNRASLLYFSSPFFSRTIIASYPYFIEALLAISVLNRKPKDICVLLSFYVGALFTTQTIKLVTNSLHQGGNLLFNYSTFLIAFLLMFFACSHPGWKKIGIISSIFTAIWAINYLLFNPFTNFSLLTVINALWMIALAFSLSRSILLEPVEKDINYE